MAQVTFILAFLAGISSFLAPCILPIIPGFLAYLAGSSVNDKNKRWSVFVSSVFFVLGFSVVFALMGVLLNSILERFAFAATVWLSRIAGIIIILFGLNLAGFISIPWLQSEHKFMVKKTGSRHLTSFLFGASFAAGWTPCVGPALGAILGLAATQPVNAFGLLLTYSIGLGIPFLLVGLFAQRASVFLHKHAAAFAWISKAFGFLLIIIGVLVFAQRLDIIANWSILNRVFLS